MKRSLVVYALLALLIAPFGATYAKDDKSSKNSSKENASVGTKELLARIEALEAAVAGLGGGDNSVAGHEYRIMNFGAGVAEFVPFAGQFHLVFNADRSLVFNADGTGNRVTLVCNNQQLTVIPPNPPSLAPAGPGCSPAINGAFTWVQIGNELEISGPGGTGILLVSDSGDTVMGTGFATFGGGTPFNLSSGSITVGLRLSN